MTVSEKLRLVQGLHSHAEVFGFNWDDGSDWTWHDVTCKIADEIDAENAELRMRITSLEAALEGTHLIREQDMAENAKLRELAKGLSWCSEERYLGHQESECPLYDERTDGKCRAEALMKELGVEVDG